jgi:hypothetical protein
MNGDRAIATETEIDLALERAVATALGDTGPPPAPTATVEAGSEVEPDDTVVPRMPRRGSPILAADTGVSDARYQAERSR